MSLDPMIARIVRDGYRAQQQGVPHQDNPYISGTVGANAWAFGVNLAVLANDCRIFRWIFERRL